MESNHTSTTAAAPPEEPTVVVGRTAGTGRIELNRPRAINALGNDMVAIIDGALRQWRDDAEVARVLITGRGERGLCAGGDIKAIHASITAGDEDAMLFFATEYAMNHAIADYPKPYVAIMNGITMGGGVGVSAHGSHRIVTDSTKVGMPETGIGLFPDVGATHLLARVPDHVGTWMALTGDPVGPGTAIALGLADTFVPDARVPDLVAALEALPAEGDLEATIARFAAEAPADPTAADREWIAACFDQPTVPEVLAALDAAGSSGNEAAASAAATIRTKSPRSLAVTLEMLRTAPGMTLAEVLERDLRTGLGLARRPDLVEGIRAQVIDKDRNPQWNPATLEEISPAEVSDILDTPVERTVFA
ncbi:enoyl-CoA hydratase/isomerase family protein [Brevibacterium litoralis]|uniref:enoyl-CoA hydratase/isomerase family protein n=1 Tax=Brevibacterium litoralis TaxID=3138935 RepID=UPI0032EAEE32